MRTNPPHLVRIALLAACLAWLPTANLQAGEIHEAAVAGDLDKVKALLEADPTLLESRDKDGFTPLISACFAPPTFNPKVEVANYLIDKGADINAKNNWNGTPLYCALRNPDLIRRLIDRGADVNARAFGANGLTSLQQAAAIGELATARLLIDYGADVNGRSSDGTILQNAIKMEGDAACDMARLLLEHGARLQEFSFGNTELHLAALKNAPGTARLLIEHGADVHAVNDYGHTALFYAARHGYRRVADVLIALGADPKEIVEANYGWAPQLTEKLEPGEAFLWYLGGLAPCTGYAVKTRRHLLVFDPPAIDASPESGLANGVINPDELAGQRFIFLFTRSDRHMAKPTELAEQLPAAQFVLSAEPADTTANAPTAHCVAVPHETFSIGDIKVHAIRAAGKHAIREVDAGLSYLVEADGLKVFHAGLHASRSQGEQLDQYRQEIDFLRPFGPVDIVILPVNGRHLRRFDYEPYLYLIDQLSPKAVYLIGDDFAWEEHPKCAEALETRDVPVFYPEGGIAAGERFHYLRHPVSDGGSANLASAGSKPPGTAAGGPSGTMSVPSPEDGAAITIGFQRRIASKVLGEDRVLQISLPRNYDPESNKRYPVMYRLDGEMLFVDTVATVDLLVALEQAPGVPEMIVVGIPNPTGECRGRDMLPPSSQYAPADADPGRFLQFIKTEVVPFVDATYRTTDRRILVGQSTSGFFAWWSLLKDPQLFQGVVAISPSFADCRPYMTEEIRNLALNKGLDGTCLYLARGGQGREQGVAESIAMFTPLLEPANGMTIKTKVYEELGHVPHPALYDALKALGPSLLSRPSGNGG